MAVSIELSTRCAVNAASLYGKDMFPGIWFMVEKGVLPNQIAGVPVINVSKQFMLQQVCATRPFAVAPVVLGIGVFDSFRFVGLHVAETTPNKKVGLLARTAQVLSSQAIALPPTAVLVPSPGGCSCYYSSVLALKQSCRGLHENATPNKISGISGWKHLGQFTELMQMCSIA